MPKSVKITAKKIGELAGCCQQAVSATLSGHGNSKVSAEKREKILTLARNLNYRPNPSALRLSGRSTKTIGIISENSIFCSEFQLGLATRFRVHGYESIFVPLVTNFEEDFQINKLLDYGVDGIVSLNKQGNFEQSSLAVPSVLISYANYDVDFDWQGAAQLAVSHLLEHGHQRIAFLSDVRQYSSENMRIGFERTLREKQLDFSPGWFVELVWNERYAVQLLSLLRKEKVSAFFCTREGIAARLLVWLRRQKISVPEEVAVISATGSTYAESCFPSLTAIAYPVHAITAAAVDLLIKKIRQNELKRTEKPILIPPKLHLGHSCGCPESPMQTIWWEGLPLDLEEFDHQAYIFPEKKKIKDSEKTKPTKE